MDAADVESAEVPSPLIDRIFEADALIVGSPIYLGDVASQVHGLIERLHFCTLSYDDYSNYFKGRVDIGIRLTINAPRIFYNTAYRKKAKEAATERDKLLFFLLS